VKAFADHTCYPLLNSSLSQNPPYKKPGLQGENPVAGFIGEYLHIQRLWLIAEEVGCGSQIPPVIANSFLYASSFNTFLPAFYYFVREAVEAFIY
jgi:hypothetical protein